MKALKYIPIYVLIAGFLFSACEDPFDIDVETGESQLVVDAFITSEAVTQQIKLSKTVDFFEAGVPPAASGAEVYVADQDTNIWIFQESNTGSGVYEWSPTALLPYPFSNIGKVGDTLGLFIIYEGDTFVSTSILKRTTPIDSIAWIFEEGGTFQDEGYIAELKASDLPGVGDVYWIRTWVNGIYLSKAAEINLAYDASFTPNAVTDGIPFILPIRRSINPINDDEDEDRDNPNQYVPETPFNFGDSIRVEIWSINESTLFFLQQISNEVNNGGLFATPPTNVRTNVFNINPEADNVAVGHFCISAVSRATSVLEED
jgi:hypothetical protein